MPRRIQRLVVLITAGGLESNGLSVCSADDWVITKFTHDAIAFLGSRLVVRAREARG
jgi:hypothetical protein